MSSSRTAEGRSGIACRRSRPLTTRCPMVGDPGSPASPAAGMTRVGRGDSLALLPPPRTKTPAPRSRPGLCAVAVLRPVKGARGTGADADGGRLHLCFERWCKPSLSQPTRRPRRPARGVLWLAPNGPWRSETCYPPLRAAPTRIMARGLPPVSGATPPGNARLGPRRRRVRYSRRRRHRPHPPRRPLRTHPSVGTGGEMMAEIGADV